MRFKIRVERPSAGQARICILDRDGNMVQEYLETNAAKADAMTNALEANGKLNVDIG